MIFATVGTQLPFPRLMAMLDSIAGEHGLEILAQTCDDAFHARSMVCHARLSPAEFDAYVSRCHLIVSHAGIGSILNALKHSKPIVIVPRQARLGEHRNDHQMATARQLTGRKGIYVAYDEAGLRALLPNSEAMSAAGSAGDVPLAGFLRSHLAKLAGERARGRG